MVKPVIVAVDEDDAGRDPLCEALARRFANHYAIVAQTSTAR